MTRSKQSQVTDSSDALSSIFDQISSDNPHKYPSARTVTDLHRNCDVDKMAAAFHHTLGAGRYQASPGDHTHNGSDSAPLVADVTFSENVADPADTAAILKKLVEIMAGLGAINVTTDLPHGVTWNQLKNGF